MKPEFNLWAQTLYDIAEHGMLNASEEKALKEIAKEMKKFSAIVEVTKE